MALEPRDLAVSIAGVIDEKQGDDIVIYDLRGLCDISDYFVLATAGNARHVDAICDEVEETMKAQGEAPFAIEGRPDCTWLLMDYGQVLVHVFQPEARDYYRLDRMWGDAPHATMDEDGNLTWHEGRLRRRADEEAEAASDADAPDAEELIAE